MLDLGMISGRILDDRGLPVADALVGAAGADDTNIVRTNDQGRFSLSIISADPVRILVRKPGFVLGIVTGIDPAASGVELVLERSAEISGRIVGEAHPERVKVHLDRWDMSQWSPLTTGSVHLEADGRFSITRIPSGLYQVTLGPADPFLLDLMPGQVVDGLEVVLPKA